MSCDLDTPWQEWSAMKDERDAALAALRALVESMSKDPLCTWGFGGDVAAALNAAEALLEKSKP